MNLGKVKLAFTLEAKAGREPQIFPAGATIYSPIAASHYPAAARVRVDQHHCCRAGDFRKPMTEEQRIALRAALKEVHDRVHDLYPRGEQSAKDGRQLRDQLLVVDLAVHLADETIAASAPDAHQVTERTANLLYALRLIAPDRPFDRAAKLLLGEG